MPTEYHYQLPQRGKVCDAQVSWNTWESDDKEEVQYATTIIPKANIPLTLGADGIWEHNGPSVVNVNKIEILNSTDHGLGDGYSTYEVIVYHDGGEGSADIYTDKAVPHYVSMWLQLPLEWSEHGMQSDGAAHLEVSLQKKGYVKPKTEYPL
jgi:hypothetical protein